MTSPDHRLGARPSRAVPRQPLPAAGPAWGGAVMGTAITSTLLTLHTGQHQWGQVAAVAFVACAWAMLLALTVLFTIQCARNHTLWRMSWTYPLRAPLWGMASMGFLATGSATASTVSSIWPEHAGTAWWINGTTWLIGTALGLATLTGFMRSMRHGTTGDRTFIRGLAVVSPMVSATVGAALVPHLPDGAAQWAMFIASTACFVAALVCGVAVFALAYLHTWRGNPVPVATSASTWIPLGMVGQSTAAVQLLHHALPSATSAPHEFLESSTHIYGITTLTIGVPLFTWALWTSARGLFQRMPFSPGWWAMTFPIGTCSLGTTLLAQSLNSAGLQHVGAALLVLLLGTWTLCAAATIRALLLAGIDR